MPSVKLLASLLPIGQRFNVRMFEDRLALQKVTYLLQEAGVDLGYEFFWYLHGPYAPSLTRDAYQLADIKITNLDLPKLDSEEAAGVEKVLHLINEIQDKTQPREYWLELLASLDFVVSRFGKKMSDKKMILSFMEKKPGRFTERDVWKALRLLQQFHAEVKKN